MVLSLCKGGDVLGVRAYCRCPSLGMVKGATGYDKYCESFGVWFNLLMRLDI